MKRNESGITLLSLALTIIVMIILASVALGLAIGNGGLIGRTGNSVNQYYNSTEQEEAGLKNFVDDFNEILNSDDGPSSGGSGDENVTISDKPEIKIVDWSETGGIVSISEKGGCTTEYRVGSDGAWQEYTGNVDVENGKTIYARYKDDEGVSPTVSKVIEDDKPPILTANIVSNEGGNITIHVSAYDNEMGMPDPTTYTYYIKKTTDNYFESDGHNTSGDYTFTGLEGNTDYIIRITTTDLAGNQGSTTLNTATGTIVEIPTLVVGENIIFTSNPDGPTKENVFVTITTQPQLESPLYLMYSTDGESYQRYTGPVEMTDNGRIWALVTDGTEQSNEVFYDVNNIDRESPNADIKVTDTTSNSITVEVTTDPEEDNLKYDYYYKEEEEDKYTHVEGDSTHTFEDLKPGKHYDIYVDVTDEAGNTDTVHVDDGTAVTEVIPSGEGEDIAHPNISIVPDPNTITNKEVTITITDNLETEYKIQYSITINGKEGNPIEYANPFTVSQNCYIKAWYTDGTNKGEPNSLDLAIIDKEKPEITATPSSETIYTEEKNVTIKVDDTGVGGFNQNQGLNYGWVENNNTVPQDLESLDGTNTAGTKNLQFTVKSGAKTGIYYLYVASIADRATNGSDEKWFGPYYFDSSAPTPTFSPDKGDEWKQQYEVDVTIPDDGSNLTEIKYEWTNGKSEPNFPSAGEDFNYESNPTITSPDGATGDDYYLWIYVKDENGNETVTPAGPFHIDNQGPNVTFGDGNYEEYEKSHTVTVNVADNEVGTINNSSLKYKWTQSNSKPSAGDFSETFNNGEGIPTPNNQTGEYWLWIYAEDSIGNETIIGKGPIRIDNTAPTATFKPNGSTIWKQAQSVTVNTADSDAKINESSLKYLWTNNATKPAKEDFNSANTFSQGSPVVSQGGTGNNYHLWIYVEDNAGNYNIIGSEAYYLDDTKPTLRPDTLPGNSNAINIQANASDIGSGIDNDSYLYYIAEDGEEFGGAESGSETHSFTELKADTTYQIKIEVWDNAGNKCDNTVIKVTTGSVESGSTVMSTQIQPSGWTNQNVLLTVSLNSGYESYSIEYKLQDGNWTDYPENGVTISTNQTVQVRPVDESDNPGAPMNIVINKIDKVPPTINAEPQKVETAVQSQQITLTATDTNNDTNVSGFPRNASLQYGWSRSNTTQPTSYSNTLTSTNSNESKTATFNVTTPTETGSYWLWVKAGSLKDNATNPIVEYKFGPYVLDNEGPSISFGTNGSTEWKKTQSTTINAEGATEIKYVWKLSSDSAPSGEGEYTNTLVNSTATIDGGEGQYILYVRAVDSLGNVSYAQSNEFYVDSVAPRVSFNQEGNGTAQKVHEVAPSVGVDDYAPLDNTTFKYLWTKTKSGINEASFPAENTFENGVSITGQDYNGYYYLWVMAKDEAGNTTIKRTESSFNFDNIAPTATFEPNGSNNSLTNSPSSKVTVSDNNAIDESSFIYYWSMDDYNSYEEIEGVGTHFTNGEAIKYDGNEDSTVSRSHKLYIGVADKAGNRALIKSEPFFIDVTPPVIEGIFQDSNHPEYNAVISTNSASLIVKAYEYFFEAGSFGNNMSFNAKIKEKNGNNSKEVNAVEILNLYNLTGEQETGNVGGKFNFTNLAANTEYEVTFTATDLAGNESEPYVFTFSTAEMPVANDSISVSLNPSSWTNQNVKVTLESREEGFSVIYRTGSSTGEYSDYNSGTGIVLDHNDTIYAKLKDSTGNVGSDVKTINITYIDKEKPTISASPESDSSYTKNKEITITANELGSDSINIAGFNTNQSLEYGWSSSDTTQPTSYTSLSGTNTAGAKQLTFRVTGNNNLNGRQYLWIKSGSVTDRANNSNNVAHFGPYYFDNSNPTLGGNGQITVIDTSSKTINVYVPSIVDNESGVPSTVQYSYYIKKTTDYSYGSAKYTGSTQYYQFTDLDDNTSYNIQVTFADNAGNIGSANTQSRTDLVPTLNSSNTTFTFYSVTSDGSVDTEISENKVSNKAIRVGVEVTPSVKADYAIQVSTDGSYYYEYTNPVMFEINGTLHVRLWDKRNSSENVGGEITKSVSNIDTSLSDLGVIVTNQDPVEDNTKVEDKDGNEITIPEGFTPLPDEESNTPNEPKVEDGVVVQDENGNQFVWIPVGNISINGYIQTINYDRYAFSNWYKAGTDTTEYQSPIRTSSLASEYFYESLNASEKQSAEDNGGFYLGRYEAGVQNQRTESSGTDDKIQIKVDSYVYNYVTQSEARQLAENMYSSNKYTSNLTSSYAWDTALEFLRITGNQAYLTNSTQGNYYNTRHGGKSQTYASVLLGTGETVAVNHLYDMGGNVYEWTTERYSNSEATKVSRGGFYGFNSSDEPVIGRFSSSNTRDQAIGFRVALFLGTVSDKEKYMDDLQVGDYVNYRYNSVNPYTKLNSSTTGSTNNYSGFGQEVVNWRVLKINDDGTVDLISDKPLTKSIYLNGAAGYNNGVYLLNDMAEALYSSNRYGGVKARSINIEDIEAELNADGINAIHGYNNSQASYNETVTYRTYRYYPSLYAEENGSGIDLLTINDPNSPVKKNGIGQSDSYYSEPNTESPGYRQANSSITMTQTFYYATMNRSYYKNSNFYDLIHTGDNYWLASRFTEANGTQYIYFGLRAVMGNNLHGNYVVNNTAMPTEMNAKLRPVVTLNGNLKIGTGDGTSPSGAYEIIE